MNFHSKEHKRAQYHGSKPGLARWRVLTSGSGHVCLSPEKARAARAMPDPSKELKALNICVSSSCSCLARNVTMPTSRSTMLGWSHFSGT